MNHDARQPAHPRQTQSYLRDLFEQHRLRPKNKLGQNFLIDLNLLDFVVRSAELDRSDLVLEVGTGTGGLTLRLAELAGSVLTVEIDAPFHELASEVLGHLNHVHLFHGDVLKNKNHLNPLVLAALAELRATYRPEEVKLIANLPYAVATPVISNLLLLPDMPLERMVVMVQWEIAERLAASPGTKDFSALSVLVQSIAEVEILRKLPPAVFWPRPQVSSAIVRIRPDPARRARVPDLQRFRNFLRDLYAHRRKNLRGGLVGMAGSRFEKPEVDARLAALGIDGTVRAETLDVAQHLRLCEAFPPEPTDSASE